MFMNVPDIQIKNFQQSETVLELLVKNHPGVMSHICGLFSRRGYNLEGIAVLPVDKGTSSKVWLKVVEQEKLVQIIKQLAKLPDVHKVFHHGAENSIFTEMAPYFEET